MLTKIKVNKSLRPQLYILYTLLTVLLQISKFFLPRMGFLLNCFTTATIGYLTYLTPLGGILGLLTSTAIVGLFQPTEVAILLLTTGPLGITLGWNQHLKKGPIHTTIWAGVILALGMIIQTFFLGLPVFGGTLEGAYSTATLVLIYMLFAQSYAWIWFRILNCFTQCVQFPNEQSTLVLGRELIRSD